MTDKGQSMGQSTSGKSRSDADSGEFVLDKVIFSNVFGKDIRRVYLYKKAERLAKAIHLIAPAFADAPALKDRLDRVAVGLVDAVSLPPAASREALARELLTLSSMLSMARTGGRLTPMNADLISREAHALLADSAGYEEPRLALDDVPSLAALAKSAPAERDAERFRSLARVSYDPQLGGEDTHTAAAPRRTRPASDSQGQSKGHIKDSAVAERAGTPAPRAQAADRREGILAVLRSKGPSYIKDISLVVRGVSEKTIQRELANLVSEGVVKKEGERRWTTYSIA